MNDSKKILMTAILLGMITLAVGAETARDIVDRADRSLIGDRIYSVSRMSIYKSGDLQPVQEVEGYSMMKDNKSYSLSIYTAPARMKGTANLMIEDDLWVRFGSTGRTRKLSSSAKKNSAGGSDFSYADMGDDGRGIAFRYNPKMIGEENIEGQPCYKIALIAKGPDAAYEKMEAFITKDSCRYLRIDYFEAGANIKSMKFSDYRQVGNLSYPFRYSMESHVEPSVTKVEVEVYEPNSPKVQDRFFTTGYLQSIR